METHTPYPFTEELKRISFTPYPLKVEDIVVAEVVSFSDTVVDVLLLEYGRLAAIIPTSEIKVKRGKAVRNYVKEGQILVAQVIRIDTEGRIDLSMKVVQEDEQKLAMEKFHRAQKVHQIVCQGCGYDVERVKGMYDDLHQMVYDSPLSDIYAYFESCLVGDAPAPTPELLTAIRHRIPMPSYTMEKEIQLRYSDSDGVAKITEQLNSWVSAGLQVFVVAPPKYKIIATANSVERAEALLAKVQSQV